MSGPNGNPLRYAHLVNAEIPAASYRLGILTNRLSLTGTLACLTLIPFGTGLIHDLDPAHPAAVGLLVLCVLTVMVFGVNVVAANKAFQQVLDLHRQALAVMPLWPVDYQSNDGRVDPPIA